MDSFTLASVYKPGNGFTAEYVYRLRDAVAKHCAVPHRFVCLTNEKLNEIETLPLVKKWHGFWNKVELFRKGLFDGPVRYLDLDTLIRSDISDILMHPHEFTVGTNWKHPESIGSAFLAWDGQEDLDYLFQQCNAGRAHEYTAWARFGDQGFLQDYLRRPFVRIDDIFPGRVVSFKYHCKVKVPEDASIIAFHGLPRPHQVNWRVE